MSYDQVMKEIQGIMNGMNYAELLPFAEEVGVQDIESFLTRKDLEQEIIRLELYAFSH